MSLGNGLFTPPVFLVLEWACSSLRKPEKNSVRKTLFTCVQTWIPVEFRNLPYPLCQLHPGDRPWIVRVLPGGTSGKEPACQCRRNKSLRLSILAWRIPWTKEPGRLQSMGCKESDTTERLHFHFHMCYRFKKHQLESQWIHYCDCPWGRKHWGHEL